MNKPKYKRLLVNVPTEDFPIIEKYSQKYGLSLSSTFVFCTKKYLEQEKAIDILPSLLQQISSVQKTTKKAKK